MIVLYVDSHNRLDIFSLVQYVRRQCVVGVYMTMSAMTFIVMMLKTRMSGKNNNEIYKKKKSPKAATFCSI